MTVQSGQLWSVSSVGRAGGLHPLGREFEPLIDYYKAIEVIKEFVLNNKILEHEFKNITKKEQRRLNSQKRKEEQKNLWNERKELILNTGIDLLKYGWIEKVIKETGLTKRMIEMTIKKFPEDFDKKVFKRGLQNK